MSFSKSSQQPVGIRAYSKKELTFMYNVSMKTFTRWLRPHLTEIGAREGRYYNVKQVQLIFNLLGFPDSVDNAT